MYGAAPDVASHGLIRDAPVAGRLLRNGAVSPSSAISLLPTRNLNVRSFAMLQTPGRQPIRLAAIARSGASVNSGPGQPLRVGDRRLATHKGQLAFSRAVIRFWLGSRAIVSSRALVAPHCRAFANIIRIRRCRSGVRQRFL